jgi:hypothetical protein
MTNLRGRGRRKERDLGWAPGQDSFVYYMATRTFIPAQWTALFEKAVVSYWNAGLGELFDGAADPVVIDVAVYAGGAP